MTRALVLLLAVAACGGSRAPARPAPPADVPALVAGLEAYAERACRCADRACTHALDLELTAWIDGSAAHALLLDPAFPRADAAVQRTIRCLWTHQTVTYAFEILFIREYTAVTEALCACDDRGCFEELTARVNGPIRRASAVPIEAHDEARSQLETQAERRSTCGEGLPP